MASLTRHKAFRFSLSSLVLFVTILACQLVCFDIERFRQQYAFVADKGHGAVVMLFGGAAMIGGAIGVACRFRHLRNWRMWLFALIAGALAGEASLLILMAPTELWRTVCATSVLLITAIVMQLSAE